MVLIEFCKRDRGMLVSAGNPLAVREIPGLKHRRVVSRQPNYASQFYLKERVLQLGVSPKLVFAGQRQEHNEEELTDVVKSGRTEFACGLRCVAKKFSLDLIPIITERFDLLLWYVVWLEPPFHRFLQFCQSKQFHEHAQALSGYNTSAFSQLYFLKCFLTRRVRKEQLRIIETET